MAIYNKIKKFYTWQYANSPACDIVTDCGGGGGGGGGASVVEVTYPALQTLISSATLVPGTIYKITGFNKNMPNGDPSNPNGYLPEVLYDDGTNSGITIYMQALSTTEMATSGYGEFYNPKYGDETTYYNTDGTGLYQIWDGDNPDPLSVPAYGVGDVVFWGGYAWVNDTGNVGNAIDIVTLSSDWDKLPYTATNWYTKVTDEIKVDWNNGIVVERYNPENQIRVAHNGDQYSWWLYYFTAQVSPISVMAWGLYSKITPEGLDSDFYGISNLEVINSWMETVNFKGAGLLNVYMDTSDFYNNYIGIDSYVDEMEMTQFSYFDSNTLTNSGYFYSNTLTSSYISSNTLTSSYINSNTLTNGSINNNTLTNSYIYNNTLTNGSINSNTLTYGYIDRNVMDIASITGNNVSGGSDITNNKLHLGYLSGATLTTTSRITSNTFSNAFGIDFTASGTLAGVTFQNNNIKSAYVTADLSLATHVYGVYTTDIFARLDGTARLSYYNNSDVLTVVAVTA